jgi:hypothetical protein
LKGIHTQPIFLNLALKSLWLPLFRLQIERM